MSTQTSWARWAATAGVRSARIACWMARGPSSLLRLLPMPTRLPPTTSSPSPARCPRPLVHHRTPAPLVELSADGTRFCLRVLRGDVLVCAPRCKPSPSSPPSSSSPPSPTTLSLVVPRSRVRTHTAPARAVESMRDGTNCRLHKLALSGDAATHAHAVCVRVESPCTALHVLLAEMRVGRVSAHVDSRMRCLSSAPRRLFLLPTHNALHLLPHLHPHLPHPILVSPSLYTTAPPHNRREVEARRHLPSTQTRTRRGYLPISWCCLLRPCPRCPRLPPFHSLVVPRPRRTLRHPSTPSS
ncbi:hypothetical protein C8F04DRAFT_1093814 [Mycena alexandri]|uniref:Uncharacterized protein n=1 Tax=Mycena alexandri TaxID=1745969 RepID=A0AAD6X9C5_9AGAR|nr:hypothetical protein C8F04DRAFT_1093814 [Mycena alexandri]